MSTRQKRDNSKTIIIILVALLALLAGFTMYNMKTNNNKVESLTSEKNAIKKDLNEKIAALDSAMTDNEQMNTELNVAKNNLIALRDSVIKIKNIDRRAINAINKRVADLEKVNKNLIREADSLRIANTRLTVENDSARADIERKEVIIEKQVATNDSLTNENLNLTDKVTKGAALSIGSIQTLAMKERRSGALKETNVARRVDVFKTNFVIRENPIAKEGLKKAYIVIEDASGKVIAPKGNFDDDSGQMIEYSDVTDVDYTNQDVDVIIITNVPEKSLDKGDYYIKVYLIDKLLGTKKVSLK